MTIAWLFLQRTKSDQLQAGRDGISLFPPLLWRSTTGDHAKLQSHPRWTARHR